MIDIKENGTYRIFMGNRMVTGVADNKVKLGMPKLGDAWFMIIIEDDAPLIESGAIQISEHTGVSLVDCMRYQTRGMYILGQDIESEMPPDPRFTDYLEL